MASAAFIIANCPGTGLTACLGPRAARYFYQSSLQENISLVVIRAIIKLKERWGFSIFVSPLPVCSRVLGRVISRSSRKVLFGRQVSLASALLYKCHL